MSRFVRANRGSQQIGVVSMHYSFEVIMPDNILRSMAGGGSIA
jgi:hypothetical protein